MKKAQNGAKTPTEKEKVDAAIKAQKARKDTLGAAEKARRAKNLEANRRARLPLAEQAALRTKTKTTTQSGGGLSKYAPRPTFTDPIESVKKPKSDK
jgi:isopropylmalate/homocitrate/citramalate synthase